MCDTFVALSNATRDGSVILAKNSDRHPNEAHELLLIPHANHMEGEQVECTYISIPQVSETYTVLLSKPFWIWGAEMGANEHGVAIGNEAVFTKVPYGKEPGLIGMDFLRLALERAATADEALDVIVDLLETYGQSGNSGLHPLYYHNSFLIADRKAAWVLETAGKHWAAEKVVDVRSISNLITIGKTWDRASDDLVSHALEEGWCKSAEEFDFGACYSDFIYTTFAAGRHRFCRTRDGLQAKKGEIDVSFAMHLLRDHGSDADEKWIPGKGITGAEVCAHASFGPVRSSQSVGSMVSHLTKDGDTHWLTGTSAPCLSTFKPVWMDSGLPDMGPHPTATYDEQTMWWRHENLHREVLRDYAVRRPVFRDDRNRLEASFLEKASELENKPKGKRAAFTEECFSQVESAEAEWLDAVTQLPIHSHRPFLDKAGWNGFDREADRKG
ncbi:MAG: C69 family dipeptidase [Anaerolineaceae bacterium]|nr:C69 family dipeptidase [Anaerolineaceae bacterium]